MPRLRHFPPAEIGAKTSEGPDVGCTVERRDGTGREGERGRDRADPGEGEGEVSWGQRWVAGDALP